MSFGVRAVLNRSAAGQPLRMDSNSVPAHSILPQHDWPCEALPVPPPALPRLPRPPHTPVCVARPRPVVVHAAAPAPPPPVRHPQATLPPKPTPSQIHATTAVPVTPLITAAAMPASPASPQAAFVFVAVTLPALVAAGAGYVSHAFGRHR